MSYLTSLLIELRNSEGLKGQLLRGAFWSLLIKLVSTLLALLTAVLLARVLGAESFGVYSFVFALVSILAVPAQMGLPNLVVRETAKSLAADRWDIVRGLWRWSSASSLSISLALILLGALVATSLPDLLSVAQTKALWWGLLLIPLVALGNLRGAALRGMGKIVQGQLPEFVLRPTFLMIGVLGAVGVMDKSPSASQVMMLHVIAAILAFVVGAFLLAISIPPRVRLDRVFADEKKKWASIALPFAAIAIINQITKTSDLIFVGALLPSEEAGIYRIAAQASDLVSFGMMVINIVAAPYLARFHAEGDVEALQRIVSVCAIAALTVSAPTLIMYVLFAPEAIDAILGSGYSDAYLPLLILSVGQVVRSFFAVSGVLVSMTGHERAALVVLMAVLVFHLCLNALLIPRYGIIGASLATALGVTLEGVALSVLAARRLPIKTTILSLMKRKHGRS